MKSVIHRFHCVSRAFASLKMCVLSWVWIALFLMLAVAGAHGAVTVNKTFSPSSTTSMGASLAITLGDTGTVAGLTTSADSTSGKAGLARVHATQDG